MRVRVCVRIRQKSIQIEDTMSRMLQKCDKLLQIMMSQPLYTVDNLHFYASNKENKNKCSYFFNLMHNREVIDSVQGLRHINLHRVCRFLLIFLP